MTNPNNSVGTNGAFGGRTSVNAFNDIMAGFTQGILSGWGCSPNSGLTVSVGGDGTHRDVAIAVDNAGNKTSINNISGSPINVSLSAAPGSNSRIDAIVVYVDNPPSGNTTTTDNPAACGIIVVKGTAASTPSAPNESQIRSGITADGASGTTAYYAVIAYITMASGTTDITSNMIATGKISQLNTAQIDTSAFGGNYSLTEQNTGYTWVNGKTIYKKTFNTGTLPNATTKTIAHGISGLSRVLKFEGYAYNTNDNETQGLPMVTQDSNYLVAVTANATNLIISAAGDRSMFTESFVTIYYVKS